MISQEEIGTIQEVVDEFLRQMKFGDFKLAIAPFLGDGQDRQNGATINIVLPGPQVLIGQDGNTLLDLQRILRIILQKKLGKIFYVRVDVNGYWSKKVESLKKMVREAADQVALTRLSRTLPPMSSFERRVAHSELAGRSDVTTQSQGEGLERSVVITAK